MGSRNTAKDGTASSSSPSSSSAGKNNSKASSQFNEDANLLAEFEQTGKTGNTFNYPRLLQTAKKPVPEEQIVAYLTKIQRGGLIQSFGCLFAVEEPSFRILAHSENSIEMLDLESLDTLLDSKPCIKLLGIDARTLFTHSSGESLTKATASNDISLFNPVSVHSKCTQKPFYAILHRIDVGIVIDLEPVRSGDKTFSVAGAMQSQKLAVQAISRLQSLPGGDISLLCDTLVEDIQQLTGYDRVMVYKFHEDEHGEVVSEIRRSDLEPYLGLHYPATDIPQVTRFLFKQNRVRVIYDCHANPACIVQARELKQPLCLVNSTLRSPHGCHTQYMANMGSVASLVMAIIVKGNGSLKLWGLVACHHCSSRYVSFPLRYACEFLMQAFSIQLNMELQLLEKLEETKTLRTQTMLCDMLIRDVPLGLVSQSPNIMDLVKCDGAALYYGGMCRLLGVTPTELQIKDIMGWLITYDSESTGLSTDSLVDAGYPGAALLQDMVCGMATVRITSNDFLFWFRSHTAKEVKWGGAKHNPEDKDNNGRMHPRSSFKAFLEVVKNRSLPWDVLEMNAIHSLQLIMRGHSGATIMDNALANSFSTLQVDELRSVACEMVRFIETASTPIFAIDLDGTINGWNAKMAELTGLLASDAVGKSLVNELVHEESQVMCENHLSRAMRGVEDKNIELKLRKFGQEQQNEVVVIVANACASRDCANSVVGVCFMGQDVTEEKAVMDKFIRLQGDYKAIIQSLNPLIPPIFASDENACCCEWNTAMEKLTGWTRSEVIGKMLAGEIFGGLCRMKNQDAITKFMVLLYQAICSHVTEKFPFTFADRKGKFMEFLVTANKRTDMGGSVIGCFCFLHNITPDLQQVLEVQTQPERRCFARLKELVYIQQEMKIPLSAIRFSHKKILESTSVSDEMKQFLETSDACEKQMMKIIEDSGIETIEEGSMELNMGWFFLGSAIDAVVSQIMGLLRANKLQLIQEIPDQVRALFVYCDQVRLQQVLSAFLLHIVYHASYPDGWVEFIVTSRLKSNQDGIEFVQLQFRMTHPGQGLPSELIQDMVGGGTQWVSPEGIGLSLSRKLLKLMNGQVHYIRDSSKCFFLVDIEFQTAAKMFTNSEVDVN